MSALEELKDFHRFLDNKIKQGADDLHPADALEEWALSREHHDSEFEDTVTAVKHAIQVMESGGVAITHEEFKREFEARHGLSNPS